MAKIDTTKYSFVIPEHADGTIASYPAILTLQNRQRFYLLSIPVNDITPYCYVVRRNEDPKLGFQRLLSEERALDIKNYLDDQKGSIPTNIVLSSQDNAELQYDRKTKTLKYTRNKKAFLIIDGQHRLYGYSITTGKHRIPVAIYEGLSRDQEVGLFMDINTNQRGVPAALILDIQALAKKENEKDAELRKLFDRLMSDPSSPLCGILSPSASLRGKISRVTFNRSAESFVTSTSVIGLSEDSKYKVFNNYLKAWDNTLRKSSLLRRSAYFEAICSLFDEIISITKTKYGDIKYDSIVKSLLPIGGIDLDEISTRGKTTVTKNGIIPILRNQITRVQIKDEET